MNGAIRSPASCGGRVDPVGAFQVSFRKAGYNGVKRAVALLGIRYADGHPGLQKRFTLSEHGGGIVNS